MPPRDQHIAGQAEFVCTHLGVGGWGAASCESTGSPPYPYGCRGDRRPAHGVLVRAYAHGVIVVLVEGEANTLPRCGVSVTGPRYALRGKLIFNT